MSGATLVTIWTEGPKRLWGGRAAMVVPEPAEPLTCVGRTLERPVSAPICVFGAIGLDEDPATTRPSEFSSKAHSIRGTLRVPASTMSSRPAPPRGWLSVDAGRYLVRNRGKRSIDQGDVGLCEAADKNRFPLQQSRDRIGLGRPSQGCNCREQYEGQGTGAQRKQPCNMGAAEPGAGQTPPRRTIEVWFLSDREHSAHTSAQE